MSDWDSPPRIFYQGRLWDGEWMANAMPVDLVGAPCEWCPELIDIEDDAVKMPHITAHLECHLRFALGSPAHLEGRCSCYGRHLPDSATPYLSVRDEARATLRWLIEHNRGRFLPT